LGEIIHYLKHLKSNVDVVLSSFYFSLDMRQNKITPRKISKKSSIIYTTFDKFKTNSILTHHALCFNTKFLLNKLHVEERFRFSDNILIYKVILFSKKIAILPKQFILYRYHIGVPEQQTSLEQMVNHYQDARKTLTIISQIKLDNHMSKRRIKTLWIILKSMYFFSLILISLNKKLYFWQKKMNFELIKKSVEQARKNGYDKIIKQSPIPFLNKLNFFSTKTISVAAFKLIQVGFIKIIKDSERLTKNKKSIY
jgi:hypothetical protein